MLMMEVRAELYEKHTIRDLPIAIQSAVIRETEETITKYYKLIPKEGADNELSDE